ncbi:MAG: TatD family hydrolase [Candidatus Aenigmarchaeota archaeon]|nr:TatD family hydrolase [Candidatus Aenigmarchaeota archaeon]
MIDAHCHLTFSNFDNRRGEIVKDSMKSMDAVIDSAPSIGDSEKSIKLAENYPNFIFSCIGLHPEEIPKLSARQIDSHIEFIKANSEKIIAIGEVGIDNFHVKNEPDRQKCRDVFVQFIELAKELNKPLVIHSREDNGEAIVILENNDAKKVIMHCFGAELFAARVAENKWFASIPTLIVRSNKHKRIAKQMPLDLLLTETDSPFLNPVHGQDNVPKNVRLVVESIASQKGIKIAESDEATTKNAIRAFNLPIDAHDIKTA